MKRLLVSLAFVGALTACGGSSVPSDNSSGSKGDGATTKQDSGMHVQLIDGVPCIIVESGTYGGIALSCDWSHYGGNQ